MLPRAGRDDYLGGQTVAAWPQLSKRLIPLPAGRQRLHCASLEWPLTPEAAPK
jgi:hypothetical protein